jgi:hypothetical protein
LPYFVPWPSLVPSQWLVPLSSSAHVR